MKLQAIALVNDDRVLSDNLARSPDVVSGALPLTIVRAATSAALGYNAALDACDGDWAILAHQDVYLPQGFAERFATRLAEREAIDPAVAVVGLYGVRAGQYSGRLWCSANDCELAGSGADGAAVEALDEVLLAVKPASGVRFDSALPGFHLYGLDIVLAARAAQASACVLCEPIVHNALPVVTLDRGYRRAWRYMRRRHWAELPLPTLVAPVTRSFYTLLHSYIWLRYANRGRQSRGMRREPGDAIARRLGYE